MITNNTVDKSQKNMPESTQKDELEILTLFDAIKADNSQKAWDIILENPKQINLVDLFGSTPLHYAAGKNMSAFVKLFLEKNIDVNVLNSGDATALFAAAGNGSIEAVEILIKHGANVNQLNINMASPIFIAAAGGFKKIVELLMHAGANPYIPTMHDITPYEIATAKGFKDIATMIANLANRYYGDKKISNVTHLKDYSSNADITEISSTKNSAENTIENIKMTGK